MNRSRPGTDDDEPPPILGSWRRLYALVIAILVAEMVLLALLTRAFA